jgi:hypothetical protein
MPSPFENIKYIATKSSNKNISKINIHQIKGTRTVLKEVNTYPTKMMPIPQNDISSLSIRGK